MSRRFRPSRRPTALVALLLLGLVALRLGQGCLLEPAPQAVAEGTYRLQRVVDGDTLLLENGARLRLIGVDTPETVKEDSPVEPWGSEASAFSKEFLSAGEVRLQLDRERVDQYDRFLVYAWVGERLLNEELLRAGLARARLGFNYSESFKRRFRAAEAEARDARRGIWSRQNVGN